jgi:hypothetical protein
MWASHRTYGGVGEEFDEGGIAIRPGRMTAAALAIDGLTARGTPAPGDTALAAAFRGSHVDRLQRAHHSTAWRPKPGKWWSAAPCITSTARGGGHSYLARSAAVNPAGLGAMPAMRCERVDATTRAVATVPPSECPVRNTRAGSTHQCRAIVMAPGSDPVEASHRGDAR